jgi:hypothetical protein
MKLIAASEEKFKWKSGTQNVKIRRLQGGNIYYRLFRIK